MLHRMMTVLPYAFLIVALAQVIGFLLLHENYLAGAWTVTSIVLLVLIATVEVTKDTIAQLRAQEARNEYLTDVIARVVERDNREARTKRG